MTHSISDYSVLMWASNSEDIELGVKYGQITMEQVEAALAEWREFIDALEKEWTPEKLKEWIVNYYAEKYKSTQAFTEKLELKNRDDRIKGVSFKDRQPLSRKIEVGHKVLGDIKKAWDDSKRQTYNVHQFLELVDMPEVKQKGFEHHLKHWFW